MYFNNIPENSLVFSATSDIENVNSNDEYNFLN